MVSLLGNRAEGSNARKSQDRKMPKQSTRHQPHMQAPKKEERSAVKQETFAPHRRPVKREERASRAQQPPPEHIAEQHDRLTPKPIDTMCNPVCPLFRCTKKALIIKLVSGKPTPWCTWVNDTCIGYKCQYASCSARYMLPDGRCVAALKTREKEEDEFLKELEKEKEMSSLKNVLSRRGLSKDLEELL
jgi:hypothetical protein